MRIKMSGVGGAMAAVGVLLAGGPAEAGIAVQYYGNPVAPPPTAGSFALTPGLFDTQPSGLVTSAQLSSGSTLNFSPPLFHQLNAPAHWGRGYTGGVYSTGGGTSVTISVTGTQILALSVFTIPNPFGLFTMTATGSDGASSVSNTAIVNGKPFNSGTASGWGFYGTSGGFVQFVNISSDVDFTIGEFAYNNPTPSAASLLGLAAALGGRRRR